MTPSSFDQLRALASQMSNNPADAMALAGQLADLIRRLPPDESELMSRPRYDRASLWTLAASFELIDFADVTEAPSQVIRVPRDMWIRGVNCQVLADLPEDWLLQRNVPLASAYNNRWMVELNWRVDAKQGFISDGQSEILESAAQITGDGEWSSPLDWQLQQNQTIEVRCRQMLSQVYAVADDDWPTSLRWVVVAFWGEDMHNRSVKP